MIPTLCTLRTYEYYKEKSLTTFCFINSTGSPILLFGALPTSTLLSTEGLFRLQRARLSCPEVLTPHHKVPPQLRPQLKRSPLRIYLRDESTCRLSQGTRQAGVNGRTSQGFRLQLSRAIPIHGGCLTEFSTNQNHQAGSVMLQPLWLRTPRIAPSKIAPLVLLN
jgi:hypothetical protein